VKFPCPNCGRPLESCGSVSQDDGNFPVFQCDDCIATVEMFGESFDVALTFAVDGEGRAFDPASPDGSLPVCHSAGVKSD
jgi:hypothetical protein